MSSHPEHWRHRTRGFTLLETMVAFAIIVLVIGTGLAVFSQSIARQARAAEMFRLSEFARAMLTEYLVTYPDMPPTGLYANTWEWQVSEATYPVPQVEILGLDMHYRLVTIEVWENSTPQEVFTLDTVVARRGIAP